MEKALKAVCFNDIKERERGREQRTRSCLENVIQSEWHFPSFESRSGFLANEPKSASL